MNKFKFLGSTLMAAFFAFGLASCEKEDFNTKVDIEGDEVIIPGDEPDKKGDAVISVQPTVWALIDGEISNVTSESTITYNGKTKLEYTVNSDQGTSAMTIAIIATYDAKVGNETKTLTATASVEVPALSAGQVYVVSPTLIMRAQSDINTPELPEGYKPGDAVISIQPEVLALINGELKNVTGEANVTFNGAEKFTYTLNEDKGTSEMSVKIDASYATTVDGEAMTLTATTTIEIPALSAGQVAIFMPQLIVSYNSEEDDDDPIVIPGTPGSNTYTVWTSDKLEGKKESVHYDYKNSSNYYYDSYLFKAPIKEWGTKLEGEPVIYDAKYNETVNNFVSNWVIAGEKEFEFKGVTLYANSVTCVTAEITYNRVKWTLLERETGSSNAGKIVAELILREDEGWEVIGSESLHINGHGHGSSGHGHGHGNGHGHGHGADNAGGGIVWPM